MRQLDGRQVIRLVFSVAVMIALAGLGLLVARTAIGDLPAREQATAWRWFAGGWVAVTIGAGLAYLPKWLNNTLGPQSTQQLAEYDVFRKNLRRSAVGICVGLGPVMGYVGSGIVAAVAAVTSGMATFVLAYFAAMLFTKKGQAMRARQLELRAKLKSETR